MANTLPREKYGKKLLYRNSGGAIATIILSIIMIGLYVATFFVPYAWFTEGFGNPRSPTGVDFIMYVVKSFTTETVPAMEALTEDIKTLVFDGNGMVNVICNVFYFIMAFFFVLVGIFALVLLIGNIILLTTGKLKHWKLPASMSKRIFIYGIFFYSPICLINLYNAVVKPNIPSLAPGTPAQTFPCFFTYGILGLNFILALAIGLIYTYCFKDHVYVKDEETLNRYIEEYEKETVAVDLTEKEDIKKMEEESKKPAKPQEEVDKEKLLGELPTPVMPVTASPVKKAESDAGKHLPKGLKVIGGHAFSQNTLLEDADIPDGIDVLGCGAFANCVNLRRVHIPVSVKKIEYNCFFNCIRLEKITYGGTRENWRKIKRGSNWLTSSGTNIVNCLDGAIAVERTK